MTTAGRTSPTPSSDGPDRTARSRADQLRRLWAPLFVIVGALLWWPVGFLGLASWLHLPLDVFEGNVLFLGATAAAASVSLVVRSPWPRFAIVLVFSALGWVIGGPTAVLAVVAGLSPTTWRGLALALALALPFAAATWQRVAPTLLSLVRLVLTWLVFALLAKALSYGWELVRPGSGGVPVSEQARTVADASWDFVRTQWWNYSEALLTSSTRWFVIAAVLVVVVLRAGRGGLRRRSAAKG